MRRLTVEVTDRLEGLAARLVFFLVGLLPIPWALRLGGAAGALLSRVSLRRAEVALVNLRIAFPEWSEEERRRVMRRSFANLGRIATEATRLPRLTSEELLERTRVEGGEHLDRALATSESGVLVVTAHVGNWELFGPAMAARGYPITIVYRPRENPHVERSLNAWRTRPGLEFLARGSAARGVLRALRNGRIAALPMDQNAHAREGQFVPFFGRLACTRNGPARIAMRTGAPLVPAFIYREEDGIHHVMRIGAPLPLRPASEPDALAENLRMINQAIEDAIRAAPDQWTWNHRRWKVQPTGEPRPYRSKRRPGPLAALFQRDPSPRVGPAQVPLDPRR